MAGLDDTIVKFHLVVLMVMEESGTIHPKGGGRLSTLRLYQEA